jgi:hypothetical protein
MFDVQRSSFKLVRRSFVEFVLYSLLLQFLSLRPKRNQSGRVDRQYKTTIVKNNTSTTTYAREERAMEKTILFIAAGIIAFCIAPIATTQAMPRVLESQSSIASKPTSAILPVLESCDVVTGLGNPTLKDNLVSYDMLELHGTTIARGGRSKGSRSPGNNNPYVKRTGHGRSTMGDNYDNESDGEDEEYGDDSAVEYNEDLEDSSGYNEDL